MTDFEIIILQDTKTRLQMRYYTTLRFTLRIKRCNSNNCYYLKTREAFLSLDDLRILK